MCLRRVPREKQEFPLSGARDPSFCQLGLCSSSSVFCFVLSVEFVFVLVILILFFVFLNIPYEIHLLLYNQIILTDLFLGNSLFQLTVTSSCFLIYGSLGGSHTFNRSSLFAVSYVSLYICSYVRVFQLCNFGIRSMLNNAP